MSNTYTRTLFGLITTLTLGWSMSVSADTASNLLFINDDAADNTTSLTLESDGFGNAGLCNENGNLEFFVLNTCGGSDQEMTLASNGNLGIGVGAPTEDLHIARGNSPTVRLEQDGSSGFSQQTWDIVGNEANFFIRDTTNGDALPFRIRPGAPTNSLVVGDDGNVGLGTLNSEAPLHVRRGDNTFEMLYLEQHNTGVVQDRNMMQLDNNGGIRFEFLNTALATTWRFQAATGGADAFEITKVGTGDIELRLDASGNLDVLGAVNSSSSRTVKSAIEPVEGAVTLAKLADLPIAEWTYTRDTDGIRHLSPMAEDFYAAFGLGPDDKHITAQDLGGVALAAIKALNQRSEQQQLTIKAQQERIAELEQWNKQMQVRITVLEQVEARVVALEASLRREQAASRH